MPRKRKETTETEIEIIKTQLEVQGFVLTRLVNELYSNIGQMMSSTKMLLGITERNWAPPPETLLEAHKTLATAIEDLRDLCRPLNNNWLSDFDLAAQLAAELTRVNQEHPDLVVCGELDLPQKLSPVCQLLLFSIAQEAVHNALKHAAAKKIEINVVNHRQNLELSVSDDGAGFDKSPPNTTGRGIRNMQLRSELLGGTIEWKTGTGNGTTVLMRIPSNIIKQHTHGHHHRSSR